jgi:pyridoxal phosphate enzyme (YggS family)
MSKAVSTTLAERIASVKNEVSLAAARAGRDSTEITIVAVTKTVDRATVDEAYAAGLRHFAENRVQDALRKFQFPLPLDAELSMVGHLQSNKAGPAVRLFHRVDSVDRRSIIEALERHAGNFGVVLPVLLQVNVAGEVQKAGCNTEEAFALAKHILEQSHLRLDGLMTIAPLAESPESARPVFRELRALRDRLQSLLPAANLQTLSMGMSDDFVVAIEEGATRVRIGRALFS